jgi:hypothetical protein
MLVGVVVAPNGVAVTWTLTSPAAVPEATVIVRILFWVGVALDGLNEVQVTPEGRGVMHDSVTDRAVPAANVAVIVTVPELPAWMETGPLLESE